MHNKSDLSKKRDCRPFRSPRGLSRLSVLFRLATKIAPGPGFIPFSTMTRAWIFEYAKHTKKTLLPRYAYPTALTWFRTTITERPENSILITWPSLPDSDVASDKARFPTWNSAQHAELLTHSGGTLLTSYKLFLAKRSSEKFTIQQEKWVVLCLLMYFGWEQWSRWRGEWRNVGAKKFDGENTKETGVWSRRKGSEKMTKHLDLERCEHRVQHQMEIHKRAAPYSCCQSRRCNLCLAEMLAILQEDKRS